MLDGAARVVEQGERDVFDAFVAGAEATLRLALTTGCRFALLTDGSPSCGSGLIHDGAFTGRRRPGQGVTAALLRRNGVAVFAPDRIGELAAAMDG